VLILEALFERLGINDAIERIGRAHPRLELSLRSAIFQLVVARMVRPSSKLFAYEHLLDRLYVGGEIIPLQHLYRAMDLLAEHKEDIEQTLFFHGKDLLSAPVDVLLYDLTTLRFESTRVGGLRQFGFSKEMRSDCTQLVLGLLVDPNGVPLGFEVFAGNTFEGNTLESIIKKVREKFKVRRFIFVADRGLFSAANLDTIANAQGQFLVGMRMGHLSRKRPDFYDRSHFKVLHEDVEVFDTTHDGRRVIISWSKERADRDAKVRNDILAKIRAKLAKKKVTAKNFVSNANYKFFIRGLSDTGDLILDEKAIECSKAKDGFFAIVTNITDKSVQELFTQYRQLWRIEDAFGEFKGTLKARPVFHWTDPRILGHLTLCFLALVCEAHITVALRHVAVTKTSAAIDDKVIKPRPLSAATTLAELAEVRAIPVAIGEKTIWLRTDITGNTAALFRALQLKIPPKLLSGQVA
jgi:transposase